jgi:alanyl-tRNA synthetase
MISSAEVRSRFLKYFEQVGHTIVKSSSLLPGNDPTLLFANAGMVPFKDVFLGLEVRPYSRATTSQKCMRVSGKHNDLESVGPSPRHHTFFEMLGNFSFGDYFKRDAIRYAWTFLTQEIGLDPQKLLPTVYVEDDEAFGLWQEMGGLAAERITRLGKKDNFWAMGDTGPCGPCSEILYDRGAQFCSCGRPDCSPATGCDRFLEFWNLVFMQYETHEDGSVTPLPRPSIDTGMGLERITAILQGVDNNYDTDLFMPIMNRTRELLGHDLATMQANLVAYRVIADHSRAITFLIADGVLPGNEGRNYVLRLILRRAARFGKLLGFEQPFLAQTAQAVIDTMGHHYTELEERADFIREVITREEERFLATLSVGLSRLDQIVGRMQAEESRVVSGEEAFRLYDTYGFPLELTRDAAHERGLVVDEEGFRLAMAAQRERARSAQRFGVGAESELYRRLDLPRAEFLGYDTCRAETYVLALVYNGQRLARADAPKASAEADEPLEAEEIEVVLTATPFYPEGGGQMGDTGELRTRDSRIVITSTFRPVPDTIVHRGYVQTGSIAEGERVMAIVDEDRRLDIARNHTGTHLLHRALRQVLGEHATQAGSLVAPDRLRFDLAHLSALTRDELRRIEAIINEQIRLNRPISTQVLPYEEAVRQGAIALFGEKYGDVVRSVRVEGFTNELCGGTHLRATGEIGTFVIVGESSVGSGLRRIEALTGRGAASYLRGRLDTLEVMAEMLGARPGEEIERLTELTEESREQRRTLQELQRKLAAQSVDSLLSQVAEVHGVRVLSTRVDVTEVNTLREMCDHFRDKLGSAVVALGAVVENRPIVVVAVTQDLIDRGLHAGKLAGAVAQRMGGGGGGRPNMAQAGGKEASRLNEALGTVPGLVLDVLR